MEFISRRLDSHSIKHYHLGRALFVTKLLLFYSVLSPVVPTIIFTDVFLQLVIIFSR